jgi:FkbM family methyltransferase
MLNTTRASNMRIPVESEDCPLTGVESVFWTRLTTELLSSSFRYESDNSERIRSKYNLLSLKLALKAKILSLAASSGFFRAPPIDYGVVKIDGLSRAYLLLQDQSSRDLFVKLLAYRILGNRHVRLPLNNAEYWRLRWSGEQHVEKRNTFTGIPLLESLDLCNVNGIRLHAHPQTVVNTFQLEQYRCSRAEIGVKPGDVVIDGGGCWGDTALYFAQQAGRVFCFECMPSNITIIEENLRLNPSLAARISMVPKALGSRSGEKAVFEDFGPGSRASFDKNGVEVETQAIDDFVAANSLERVDFIKMDIEGAEPDALIGAEQTLRRHRPQLAISIYHETRHFASIPNWLASLNLGYRFFLDHFTIHDEETVLFARAEG